MFLDKVVLITGGAHGYVDKQPPGLQSLPDLDFPTVRDSP